MLTYAELFAGAGGLSMGLEAAGFHAVVHAEIEPHARAVLRHHWPNIRLDGDVTQINGADYRGVTLMSGGSPCQDLSVAGKRAGLGGARSGLFYEQLRLWHESQAPYLLWENVYGALSSNHGHDFAAVLSAIVGRDLVEDGAVPTIRTGKLKWLRAGRAVGPTAVACWRVLDLQHFGPPQRRVRVFVLAARTGNIDPAEILLEPESGGRHTAACRSPREGAAGGVENGAGGGALAFVMRGREHGVQAEVSTLSPAFATPGGGSSHAHVLAFHHTQTPVSGRDSPAIGVETNGMGVLAYGRASFGAWGRGDDFAPVCSRDYKDASTLVMAHGQANAEIVRDGEPSLTCLHEAPIVLPTLAMGAHTAAPGSNGQDALQYADAKQSVGVDRPRRLTPKECERLMSWPDDHTRYGRKDDGTVYELSDTARYRLCGNGVGSVCVQWIAERLRDAINRQTIG